MKSLLSLALLLCLTACETKTPPETSAKVLTQTEVHEQVKTEVKDVRKGHGPKWKVDYKGDLNGSIEGSILSVVSVTQTIAVGGTMNKDSTGKAAQSLRMTQMHSKDNAIANVQLVLADGTKCLDVSKKDNTPSDLKVIDGNTKSFHATLKGALTCGDAKHITYIALLKKK